MKHCYLISGLGADERAFQNLEINHHIIYLPWLIPLCNETIESYARRMADNISEPKPVLIGLSFGGMIAVEIAKLIETEKVILISSAKTKNEIPFYYRVAGKLFFHKILPLSAMNKSGIGLSALFNFNSTEERKLFKTMLKESDFNFLKWAIDRIVKWKNKTELKNIYHLHGDADNILPIIFVKTNNRIKGGGHMMVLNKADQVSNFVNSVLNNKN